MQVNFINFSPAKNNLYAANSRLKHNNVSFQAMKKPQFDGIDFAVVEKYKAPIEKFNSNQDLQNWAGEQTDKITAKNYGGRSQQSAIQRKNILKEWTDYVLNNDKFSNTTAFLILNAVTKELKPNTDTLPPKLNTEILNECINEIDLNIRKDKKYQFNLNKMYETKLRKQYHQWVVIPSMKKCPENFDQNIEKLRLLSHKNWCTKSFNAKPYLVDGDFHIYLENGSPKLAIRLTGDKIFEVEGELNNGKIPLSYLNILEERINNNNLKLWSDAQRALNTAENIKAQILKAKNDLKDSINDTKTIFEYFGIKTEEDKNGLLTIDNYKQPDNFTYADLGIDENTLLEKVKSITGNANFRYSTVTKLPNLKSIGDNAVFSHSDLISVPELEIIGGNVELINAELKELPKLRAIGDSINLKNSKLISMPNLEEIGNDIYLQNSQITTLPKLKSIGRNAYFNDSKLKSVPKLEKINGNIKLENSILEEMPNLKTINGNAIFNDSVLKSLPELETIRGKAEFINSELNELPKLRLIGSNADFEDSKLTSMPNLEVILRSAFFSNSLLTELPKLKLIGWIANFNDSMLVSLPNLQSIGGDAHFFNSKLTTIPNLKSIDGKADFEYSNLRSLPKLKSIDGKPVSQQEILDIILKKH